MRCTHDKFEVTLNANVALKNILHSLNHASQMDEFEAINYKYECKNSNINELLLVEVSRR